jgi:hypothetical protein
MAAPPEPPVMLPVKVIMPLERFTTDGEVDTPPPINDPEEVIFIVPAFPL